MSAMGVLKRLQHGMPAILLGTLFNVLDAVSTGLLVFPSDGNAFAGLQNKSMSTYIFSTIICQVAMTAGGSLFPGALGAMLIEVLPFMRGVASDIRNALGDDNPAVVPTVMVAYSLSSVLIGIIFLLLGALGFGRLISYFPQTVLTGAIGGIGVSLFILGLELPLPSDHSLTLSNAGSVLFSRQHVPVLLASLLPIAFMCFSVRSKTLNKLTRGGVQHPYYVPLYFLALAALFWVIVGGLGVEKLGGLHALVAGGWLFSTGEALDSSNANLADALNYWSLFDFRLVEISALRHAVTNFVLLVVIGVLNLPVYVPALALALDVPYSMNHELIGQGAANILAGAIGSLPNILQLSYSVFFTRAGGRRVEASVVIVLTLGLYFASSYLLCYIPTILASGLVLFLGIELTFEAAWESAKDLIWSEWLVVMATLLSCTFLGFAPGVGVGLAAAMMVYTGWGCWDLRAKAGYVDRNLAILYQHSRRLQNKPQSRVRASVSYTRLPDTSLEESGASGLEEKLHSQIRHVYLNGYVFFGVIPSVEAQLTAQVKTKGSKKRVEESAGDQHQYVIVDMQTVHRVETAAAKVIRTKARDEPEITLLLCGFSEGSGTAADLVRSGLELRYGPSVDVGASQKETYIRVFEDSASAATWCKKDLARRETSRASGPIRTSEWPRQQFLDLFVESSSANTDTIDPSDDEGEVNVYQPIMGVITRPLPEANTAHFTFVLSGSLALRPRDVGLASPAASIPPVRYNRASLHASIVGTCRRGLDSAMKRPSHREAARPQEGVFLSSSSDSNDGLTTAEKMLASTGHTLYVLNWTGTAEDSPLSPVAVSGKPATVSMCTDMGVVSPASIHEWPMDYPDAVVLDKPEDSCWLVDVRVPCVAPPTSPSSLDALRRQAARRVIIEVGTESRFGN